MGVSIIIYIDDILVFSETSDKCREDAQFVIDKLVELGLHIKKEKCSWDTNTMLCQLPEEKLLNIKSLCCARRS